MKTKLQPSPRISTKSVLLYTCTGIAALLVGIGVFFYFNMGTSAPTKAATTGVGDVIRSKGNGGDWDNQGSWNPSRVPENGDRVIIEKGDVITIDSDESLNGEIIVNGELKVENARLSMNDTSKVAINEGGLITFSPFVWKVAYYIIPYQSPTGSINIGGDWGIGEFDIWAGGITMQNDPIQGPEYFPASAVFLPIELLSFDAQMTEEGDVALTWSTASEKDNDFFTIERSLDGRNFFVLDSLPGAGNSNTLREYTYTDISPVAGYNYYRLKQTDYNGKFEYFEVVTVVNDKAKPELSMVTIGPNPYREQFEVNFYSVDNNMVHLKLLDMKGKTIFSKSLEAEKGLNSYTYIDQNNLQPGIYLFTIVQKGTPAKTFRIVKSS